MPSVIDRPVLPVTGSAPVFAAHLCIGAVGVGGGTPAQDQEIAEFVVDCIVNSKSA